MIKYHPQSEKSLQIAINLLFIFVYYQGPKCGISLLFTGDKNDLGAFTVGWWMAWPRLAFLMARGGEAAANTVRGIVVNQMIGSQRGKTRGDNMF